MTDGLRRSGRQRKSNPRYSLDLTDEDEPEAIADQDESDHSSFEQIEVEIEDEDEEEDVVASEDENFIQKSNSDDQPGDEAEDDLLPMDMDTAVPMTKSTPKKKTKHVMATPDKRYRKYAGTRSDGLRTRGLLLHSSVMSREITVGEIVGYDAVLTEKLKAERAKYGGTMTLPFRKTNGPGQSGMGYPEVCDQQIRENEERSFLEWYRQHNGRETMARIQNTSKVDPNVEGLYVNTNVPPQNILLGPYDAQGYFTLNNLDSLSVSEAWSIALQSQTNGDGSGGGGGDEKGWILNSGSRVLCVEWTPNRKREYQFLAIASDKVRPPHIPRVSFLEAQEPFESSIQIWAFRTKQEGSYAMMDSTCKPRLVHVLCAAWGVIRRIAWCPAATSTEENIHSIGVLALVSTDGHLRVVDVVVDLTSDDVYVEYKTAAFTSKPPDTIFTCLTWLSADLLAAGCSNGHAAVWSMDQCMASQTERGQIGQSTPSATPFWYHPIHTTYILSIVGNQPYPCKYITTNAVDGKVRVTSLRQPYSDSCYGARERHLLPDLAYSPHILGIFEIDETDGLRARPLRHMPVSRAVGKSPAQVVCIDAGKVHSSLLFGCTDGQVIATNPIRRIFIRRVTDERVESWQQTWFKHEFVPSSRSFPIDHEASLQDELQRVTHIHPRPGTSRFLESFRLEIVPLIRSTHGRNKRTADENGNVESPAQSNNKNKSGKQIQPREGGEPSLATEEAQIAIYEEEQAVTCVAWNPNVRAGGWAAAGLANGLIRVEDLAI